MDVGLGLCPFAGRLHPWAASGQSKSGHGRRGGWDDRGCVPPTPLPSTSAVATTPLTQCDSGNACYLVSMAYDLSDPQLTLEKASFSKPINLDPPGFTASCGPASYQPSVA
jgi:hypothetical protein